MKKFLMFLGLTSVLVGCTGITNNIAMIHLDEVLGDAKNLDPDAYAVCFQYRESYCHKGIKFRDIIIVEESAEGEDRVVLKIAKDILGLPYWEYLGVDFSSDDWDAIQALPEGDRLAALGEIIAAGLEKYGYLRFEPADNEFFWEDDNGVWNIFSESVASIKDVELMGSKVEDQNAVALGEKLSAQYGLSNERGQVVAKTLSAYNKLASKRALTSQEKNQFSTKLLGVDYKTAERAVKTGSADDFQALMEQAAKTNGTSPEAVSAIIKDMVL